MLIESGRYVSGRPLGAGLGPRNPERLRENAAATEVDLTRAEIGRLDAALDVLPTKIVFGGTAQTR